MVKRVILDAMIPREDFGVDDEEHNIDLLKDFPLSHLSSDSTYLKLLRKPDFQRETNHWSPEQIVTFLASFLDGEVIPGLILWKSAMYIFVIDGGHRLSALRAWIEDDYGDGPLSQKFYNGEISKDQKKVANRTRSLVENRIGRYTTIKNLVGSTAADLKQGRRAHRAFTRALTLQWVQGTASVAETSFFKINSQGTPLDATEQMLIRNRRTAIAISARAILRCGAGHKYWSAFPDEVRIIIEELSAKIFTALFQPEVDVPLRTIDIPLGGSVSPVDALSLLIEFLMISSPRTESRISQIYEHTDDEDGTKTISVLNSAIVVANRISGSSSGSLGLLPAIYFYNERGKHSQFMFLGITYLFSEKLRNNDSEFWKKFTRSRSRMEPFLAENKSLFGIVLQNLSKGQRVSKMKDLFQYLIDESNAGRDLTPEGSIAHLGLRGRIIDVVAQTNSPTISDDTKTAVFMKKALEAALKCEVCGGFLDPPKSLSYDHIVRVRDGGKGQFANVQLCHPFCNTGVKN